MNQKNENFQQCLSDIKAVLDSHQQTFFLACGTLLGQHRENDFIAHDNDLDLGILYPDFQPGIAAKVMATGKFKRARKLGRRKDSLELKFFHNNGVRVDVFLYYPSNYPNNKPASDYYYSASFFDLCDDKPEGFCKWGRHIRGLKEVSFKGETYKVPVNTEEYLTEEYGEDWRTPKRFTYKQGLRGEYKNMIN